MHLTFFVLCSYSHPSHPVWVVQTTSCKHHDLTLCFEEISCNNDTKEIGCEHDVCTCVDIPPTPPPAQRKLSGCISIYLRRSLLFSAEIFISLVKGHIIFNFENKLLNTTYVNVAFVVSTDISIFSKVKEEFGSVRFLSLVAIFHNLWCSYSMFLCVC